MEESRAKREVAEARKNTLGAVIQAGEEGKQVFEELKNLNPNTELDAKEFGEHVKNGGWRLGLLVARNVNLDAGKGARTDITSLNFEQGSKISSRSFARQAGNISANTVTKYLNAWNAAADAGIVPHSSKLNPGQSFEFSQGEPE